MTTQSVTPGDRIAIDRHRVGGTPRQGAIIEVIGEAESRRFHVRWDDGSESNISPGADTHLEHVALPAPSSAADTCTRALSEAGERKLSLQMRSDDLASVTDATVADLIEE